METLTANQLSVYSFGNKKADGGREMKNLLGGKGANLAEMSRIGIPVPPGFTITTEVCTQYNEEGKEAVIKRIEPEVRDAITNIEQTMGAIFGDDENPLLISVRSGARVSMPGMMDTVLNLGLNDESIKGVIKMTGNERFAWDSYRRFIQMYSSVVMGLKPESKDDLDPFEEIIDHLKDKRRIEQDTQFTVQDLQDLVYDFKDIVKKRTGKPFPTNPWDQLWGAILAVFDSWNGDRAIYYRKMNGYPEDWGTAVNVQAMVFGNMGEDSGTGVCFTRDAGTGENMFNGEYLINAQGEDVVAGVRTPQQITLLGSQRWARLAQIDEEERKEKYPSLEELMPDIYKELFEYQNKLETHYQDMQDMEFTIQQGKLWILQTRNGKRTGAAMVKIAMDLLKEGLIDEKTALKRIEPNKLNELLHPVFDPEALNEADVIAQGLPASPGAATGQIIFFADEASKFKNSILVRVETSPEDVEGMHIAKGIVTARGGMTSHAAVVARGMGKCCVSGAGALKINYKNRTLKVGDHEYHEGDWISINGSTGNILEGKVATKEPELSGEFADLMNLSDTYATLDVRTNADTPKDALVARNFGAKGIGLTRTEHMFFEVDRIKAMREMILADTVKGRRQALKELLPMQRSDFEGIFRAMEGYPVTVRLLDPPLHEFVPHQLATQKELAEDLHISLSAVKSKVAELEEFNPMMGHRGCRLGTSYPEITEMQTQAILEAALKVKKDGIIVKPEIMVPLVGTVEEFKQQKAIIDATAEEVFKKRKDTVEYSVGTMMETPRATLIADKIAEDADFFSFGTNDLTQMTFGYSRDDSGKFLPIYLEKGILKHDPFEVLDQEGVGQLVEMGTQLGRKTKSNLKVGICGEHGGEPSSVAFCQKVGMNYVSCSPFRVPIARVAAAQAALM
ncbi:MAG: pyruvate, phosphate dikinase [Muricauda sp.]|jgi:pyruvate,orthophosphate dikinase|nr:pyruvate, phosphate dikinase [Allomuricauda sp.]MBO6590400.1 pyruvate, phosphate dikinase [Allomuricauda sp.]MBO6619959.1 pyruvate, phosphate dikinase [Allomuricauda sp.]MBO6645921.1 pyruvate, phosphate dikinase [Allomuricauda sp.]MBO6748297.1 pyruvate, phosphate dikinase [Allomuricauda sp.]MBO6830468.1 pyruvate, phosphate dikinase [Allomuricauda sp.]